MAPNAAIAALETEFRQLAQDARSKEGLAGFFSSAADQQAVKDAAERVILKVRAYAEAPDALDQVKTHYQVQQCSCGRCSWVLACGSAAPLGLGAALAALAATLEVRAARLPVEAALSRRRMPSAPCAALAAGT